MADLLPTKRSDTADEALADALRGPLPDLSSRKSTVGRDSFDLREALLDGGTGENLSEDLNDAIAEDVAKSVASDDHSVAEPALTLDTIDREDDASATRPRERLQTLAPKKKVAAQPKIETKRPRPSPGSSYGKGVVDRFDRGAEKAFSKSIDKPRPQSFAIEPARSPRDVSARSSHDVLQSYRQAVIVSHVQGPRSILVGREAGYEVTLENISDLPAEALSAAIRVPAWAEVVDAMSSSGVVERNGQGAESGALQWKLQKLDARSSQTLRVRLIPHSGRPLNLDVQWSQAPVHSQTVVEVLEPKLEMSIAGPDEVLFGKPQRYRLSLRNPGTGSTEGVAIRLIPPGGDSNSATTQQIGDLAPGEVREIELQLTARDAGELIMHASATAQGGLKAESIKNVICRKPELEIDWRGPDKKFVGTVAAYYFRVRNLGTAAAEAIAVRVDLPRGAELVDATEGYERDAETGVVRWHLDTIAAGQEKFIRVRCKVTRPGDNHFEVSAETDEGNLRDGKIFETEVVALADLKLEVRDPSGPISLDEPVTYEIRVFNRGSTAAENVSVVGLFSEGIDPTSVEGAQYTIRDGRVTFHPIKTLAAGGEAVFRIQAEATQVGTHVFRAEVACQDLDIKLAAEETTRFFKDEQRWEDGAAAYSAERSSEINR